MRIQHLVYGSLMVVATSWTPLFAEQATTQPTNDPKTILKELGFDPADGDKLLAGQIISRDLIDGSRKELAVSVAMLIPTPIDDVFEAARTGRTLEVARDVIEFRDLKDQRPDAASFADVGFSAEAEESTEILMLARAEKGTRFNLSTAEVERFQAIGHRFGTRGAGTDPTVGKHVNATYRSLLLDRCLAYRDGGIAAIAPYDRGGGESTQPAQELATAAAKLALADRTPDFYRALVNYPNQAVDDIENRFYWIKQRIRHRPVFILAHRMFQLKPDYALMAERQFYVGHAYNTRQIVVGCLPVPEGTLVFYTNRTSTDRVDVESVIDILHEVGRKHLRDRITEHFEAIRGSMKQESPEN